MQHFFTSVENIHDKEIMITGDDVNHIKNVLRMKPGEEISVSNGLDMKEYRCEISSIEEDRVVCSLMFVKESGVELPVNAVLFQGLPKGDKMETIIQKCTELGIYSVIPVNTKRCVMKLDPKKEKSRIARWQGIAEAAAKQSQRGVIPEIRPVMSFKEAVNLAKTFDARSIPYELAEGMKDTKNWIDQVIRLASEYSIKQKENDPADHEPISKPTVAIFIGPEGGFTEEEIGYARESGITPISLGKRILRTETAGMTVMSILMYELEITNPTDGF